MPMASSGMYEKSRPARSNTGVPSSTPRQCQRRTITTRSSPRTGTPELLRQSARRYATSSRSRSCSFDAPRRSCPESRLWPVERWRRSSYPMGALPVLTHLVLQTALHDVESVVQRHVDVGVCRVNHALAMHVDLRAGQAQRDLDVERRAFVAVSRRCFDDHLTTCDALVEPLQALHILAHA